MWWEQGGFLLVDARLLSPPQVSLEPLSMGGRVEGGLVSGGSAAGLSTAGRQQGERLRGESR